MTQLLTTETRNTIESATLIDHAFQKLFFENLDCGILVAGLTNHCDIFVKLPFSSKKYDDTGTAYKLFLFIPIENVKQA